MSRHNYSKDSIWELESTAKSYMKHLEDIINQYVDNCEKLEHKVKEIEENHDKPLAHLKIKKLETMLYSVLYKIDDEDLDCSCRSFINEEIWDWYENQQEVK
jgi:hypothetical protein